MIWITFFGQENHHAEKLSGLSYAIPLAVLLVLSTGIGAWIHPPLANVLPASVGSTMTDGKHTAEMIAVGATAFGLLVGWFLFALNKGQILAKFKETSLGGAIYYWCYNGLGFDALYDLIFVKPFLGICRLLKSDPVDKLWGVLPALAHAGNKLSTKTQTGRISTHAITFGLGLAVVLIVAMAMVV